MRGVEVAVNKLEKLNQTALSEFLIKLENKLNADIFTYYGEIVNGIDFEEDPELSSMISEYYDSLTEYIRRYNFRIFLQTRLFI